MILLHSLRIMADVLLPKPDGLPTIGADNNTIANAMNLVLNVMGAVALIIITFAGLKYVLSRGEPQATNKAKDTILYALVGLVIIVLAHYIVAFVFHKVGS